MVHICERPCHAHVSLWPPTGPGARHLMLLGRSGRGLPQPGDGPQGWASAVTVAACDAASVADMQYAASHSKVHGAHPRPLLRQRCDSASVSVHGSFVDRGRPGSTELLPTQCGTSLTRHGPQSRRAATSADPSSAGPEVAGLVHAGGALADAMLRLLRPAAVRTAFASKMAGSQAALAATAHHPLTMAAFFSSIAGALGSAGQAGYAGANAWLDSRAAQLQVMVRARHAHRQTQPARCVTAEQHTVCRCTARATNVSHCCTAPA